MKTNSVRFRRQKGLDGNNDDYSSWKDMPMESTKNSDPEKHENEGDSENMIINKRKGLKKEFQIKIQSLSTTSVLILIGLSLLLVKYLDGRLPEPLTAQDLTNGTRKFIEERARQNLIDLTTIGVRVSGSEATDMITPQNFLDILGEIKRSQTNQELNLEYEVHRPSGSFYMEEDVGDHLSVYDHIANVVAKVEPRDANLRSNHSVLINCHFDSKPGSPGATDNMISCATMLEIIRVLVTTRSSISDPLPVIKNPIVFLFNGAEELGLQGAHGFVGGHDDEGKVHPWAENLACFINLEGAGAGGREILFQTGPGNSWIMKAYAKAAPHPYGLVLAEEAFQNQLIPSDTDFRIFRDFKNIPGLDMAFIKNGYIYHTKWDQVTEIPPGSIQNVGENALGLIEHLGDLDFNDIDIEMDGPGMVFFDVFGLFMVAYSETVGIIINYLIAVTFILVAVLDLGTKGGWLKLVKTIGWFLGSTLVAWGIGISVGVAIGAFFSGVGYYKPFYTYPFLAVVIFGVPAIISQTVVLSFCWRSSQRKSWLAGKFTISILIMAATFLTRSSYVFTLILVFAIPVCLLRRFVFKKLKSPRVELLINLVIGELIPFLFASYLVITLIDVFVPIMGRSAGTNENVFMGVIISAMSCILAFNGLSSYFVGCKKIHLITALILCIFVLNPLLVFGFVGKIPFQGKTPMRLRVIDTDRTWYNADMTTVEKTDAGFWFWPVDSNTASYFPEFTRTIKEMNDFTEIDSNIDDCEDLFCNQLFLWPTSKSISKTPWIPKQSSIPTSVKDKLSLTIVKNQQLSNGGRNLTLKLTSPTQISMALSPGPNYSLENWTLGKKVGQSGYQKYKDRPTYFTYISKGYGTPEIEFSLVFQNSSSAGENTKELLNIMVVGHFMHGPDGWQDNFAEFVKKFPSWTNVMSWTSVLKQYTVL